MPLIYVSTAWIAGILSGETFSLPTALAFTGLIPFFLLLFLPRHRKPLILLGICTITFFTGISYFQWRQPANDEHHLHYYNDTGSPVIKGIISRDPETGDKTIQLRVSALSINSDSHRVSGNLLLIMPRSTGNRTYAYGDVLTIKGKLETPDQLDGFDYKAYLANRGIYSIMFYPDVEIVETGQGFKPLSWIYWLRENVARTLAKVIPEPQASLAQGLVLGLRGNIPPTIEDRFIHTGTAHLLAISGVNLSIISGMLVSLGIALFGRRNYVYIWLSLGTIWLYTLLTGMNPPVVRAAIMASLFLTAELLGRQRNASTSLVLAATVMITITPQILQDASFQMSFMAMAGLIFLFPSLQSLGRKAVHAIFPDNQTGKLIWVIDSFSVNLASVIAVWPLIAYYFGVISWFGPLATLLTMVSIPGIIITVSLCGISGLFLLPLAQVIAWLAWLFLSYLLLVVSIFDLVPFTESGFMDIRWIYIYYAATALSLWLYHHRTRLNKPLTTIGSFVSKLPMKRVIPGLMLVALLVSLTAATMPDGKLHVAFLDVGQGDAILITRGHQQILVDGGPSPESLTLELGRQMPFWDRTIDLLILTHPHADHISGLLEVLKRYRVKEVLYPDFKYDSPQLIEWHTLISQKHIKHTEAQAGQKVTFAGATIDILNPQKPFLTGTDSDIDNNGVVARLTMGKVSFLLMADVQWEAETALITRRYALTSNVLKVGHHGSNTSTSAGFLAVANPGAVVISVSADNEFGHPDTAVIARLQERAGQANIFRTDERGTIEFTTDGTRLWVK